mmetsp:Transcript_10989/g.18372  ORF Transcript_10989/g.18372 Transcript_10989/m.18372 type:complete len:92 (-) Transcript_10989:237-512(-)
MSFGGLDGFGSFKSKVSIRKKGAGGSQADRIRYEQMEQELELKEAMKTQFGMDYDEVTKPKAEVADDISFDKDGKKLWGVQALVEMEKNEE